MGVEITALINTFPRGPAGPAGASTWDEITGTATSVPFEPTTAPTHSEGLVYYDETDRSLTYYNEEADVAVNIGREMLIRVRNNSGATIANGKVVYLSGASGQLPTIALARADSESTSRVIGVATHDIENNSFGYVTTVGEVKNLNTSAFADGDSLYLSAATAGELTATAPSLPNLKIHVATVAHSHVSQGKLYVHPEDESVTSGEILDSTAIGRSLLTAANAASARSTLELGTLATQSATITDYLTISSAASTYAAKGANSDITSLSGLGVGSVSAPSISFGDADSGFYAPTSNSIAYASDGAQKFRFDAAGMTVISAGGAASRTFTIFDNSTTFSAGLVGSTTQSFGFGDILSGAIGRFERSTTTGLISFQMQAAASASLTFNIGHASASVRVRAAASATANIQEWRSSTESVLAAVAKNGAFKPASLADADAENGTLYYSTTASKLVFKDAGGTVNNLY